MQNARTIVLVTGPSGAGRTTAIRTLEDMGYEAIDNLPLSLLPRLIGEPAPTQSLVLGVDTRNREFSTHALIEAIDSLDKLSGVPVQLLYIDCNADVLLRRFSETRRRHPMAPDESPRAGIERELDLLGPIRARADLLIDTSSFSPHDLRAELAHWFGPKTGRRLAVSVQSFSYKRGLPRSADIVLDCRFLRNPYWEPSLRSLDGRAPEVAAYVAEDPLYASFQRQLSELAFLLLPAYEDEGKSYLSIALGCTGGQHRSVAMAESLTATLAERGWQVSTRHRELERRAAGPTGQMDVADAR
ncbi:RNase adapter RapZ [Pseudohalocynthiibacter aestuariivivens]|uniref:RNase adapter RapZ n=2 Tax=Roseovarius pelagicus TaxID=2980108 RepID=A0ABY6DG20_9RHOB|nr:MULTISPECIES: RNase adapter RapZ [Rhodobacterales]QIE47618.1 RNase adapter RapZ [Pseudohalocynthiibacter aestuariivivens]UXX85121.1 RNase adapter RapZ [Roseovarius pelagicus]